MKKLALAAALIGLAAAVLVLCLHRIGPDEVGVRTLNVGQRGIVPQDFGPGLHLRVPVVHTWNVFPARVRRTELTKDPRHRSAQGEDALLVQSVDGDRVMLDVHVFFRIADGQAHRLLQDSGPGDGHVAVVRSLAKDRLRAAFGKLRTEQFYDPQARERARAEAREVLKPALAARFLAIEDIVLLDIEFEPKYEQKIRDKKLADQEGELNKAQARAAAERAKVGAIQLETTRKVNLIQANSEAEAMRIAAEAAKAASRERAEAELYHQQLKAKGTLATAAAEAHVKRAKAQALAGGGGANLAALEAVANLRVTGVTFPSTGLDWIDVQRVAERLGARP